MAVDEPGRGEAAARRRSGGRRPAAPAPAPTAVIRPSSITMCPSACSVPAASTVAIAQSSMTSASLIAGRQPHRVEDLLVARAAAQVAGERLADLGVGRARRARQQVVRGDDQPRRAEAALHGAGLQERLLDRVQLVLGRREPLDGHDLAALGLAGQHQARAHELAVEVHRARAALALLAGVLGARQREPLAQHVQQALALPDAVDLARLAVDRAGQPHAAHAQVERAARQHGQRVAAVGRRCRAGRRSGGGLRDELAEALRAPRARSRRARPSRARRR